MRYPGATWDPLGAQTEPRMQAHDIACLHTMVGTLVGTDSFFEQDGYGGVESHWGLGWDGECRQWQDIGYEADANYHGNHRVLSMETADRGTGFPAWSGSDVPEWTPQQVDRLVDWLRWVTSREAHADCPPAWLCHQVGIPRVLIPDSAPGRRGIGYHRQGIDSYPELYMPGWRQPGGELWSGSRGKVCPGDRRIHQLVTIVIPRVQAATASPQEDDPMALFDTRAEFEAAVLAVIRGEFTTTSTPTRKAILELGRRAALTGARFLAIPDDFVQGGLVYYTDLTVAGTESFPQGETRHQAIKDELAANGLPTDARRVDPQVLAALTSPAES